MKDIERTTRAIKRGIVAINDVLAIGNLPAEGPTSMDQLERFRHQLSLMLNEVESQASPNQEGPLRRIGPIIIDSWPLGSELGDALLKAENEYVRHMTAKR